MSELGAAAEGAFRGGDAVRRGVSRKQVASLRAQGVITRLLPDTYALTAVPSSESQRLRAALLWAGDDAAGAARSAAVLSELPVPPAPCSR